MKEKFTYSKYGDYVSIKPPEFYLPNTRPADVTKFSDDAGNVPVYVRAGKIYYSVEKRMETWGSGERHFGTSEAARAALGDDWVEIDPNHVASCLFLSDGFAVATVGLTMNWRALKPRLVLVPSRCAIPAFMAAAKDDAIGFSGGEDDGRKFTVRNSRIAAAARIAIAGAFAQATVSAFGEVTLAGPRRELDESEWALLGYTIGIPGKLASKRAIALALPGAQRGLNVGPDVEVAHRAFDFEDSQATALPSGMVSLHSSFRVISPELAASLTGIEALANFPKGITISVSDNIYSGIQAPVSEWTGVELAPARTAGDHATGPQDIEVTYLPKSRAFSCPAGHIKRIPGDMLPALVPGADYPEFVCKNGAFAAHFMDAKLAGRQYALSVGGVATLRVLLIEKNEAVSAVLLRDLVGAPKRGQAASYTRQKNDAVEQAVLAKYPALPQGYIRGQHDLKRLLEAAEIERRIAAGELMPLDDFAQRVFSVLSGAKIEDGPTRQKVELAVRSVAEKLKFDLVFKELGTRSGHYISTQHDPEEMARCNAMRLVQAYAADKVIDAIFRQIAGDDSIREAVAMDLLAG